MAKKKTTTKKVESIRHKDKRVNIPTEELRDFVADEELDPEAMLYPRDPSLDPQLVWKGKDEQDNEDLVVPVLPIYIQEKIHPQAIIDALPRIKKLSTEQPDLFADFNGLPEQFDQRVDFYHHDGNWSNRMILGDSQLVMTSLAEKEGLKGNVQTVYFDPPYGIKFGSNWQVSTRKRDVTDGKAEDTTRQPEQVRAFRDTWKMGIHSYLPYLRDRLIVACELLTETGSIFVQIGDENVHLVRCVLDEVFGSTNFVGMISFATSTGSTSKGLPRVTDYLIWYAKDLPQIKFYQLYGDQDEAFHPSGEDEKGEYELASLTSQHPSETRGGALEFQGMSFKSTVNRQWSFDPELFWKLVISDRVVAVSDKQIRWKKYQDERVRNKLSNRWNDTQYGAFTRDKVYVVQTHTKVIERCILMTTDPGDLVLDPTCGGGTTAYVAEQWGRRWITCDTSRVALALARSRLMAAQYPYYLLTDSTEGIEMEGRISGRLPPTHSTENDIRKGFVYRRVSHLTLKSIVDNPDICEGMGQEEIDAAIFKHADTVMLYDHPYEDNKRVRVSGPFSVESLSPHRVLSAADEDLNGTVTEQEAMRQQDFATTILENLEKAGVQNTRLEERLTFNRLDPYAGTWLHATGEYTDVDGESRSVAVSIGPEHGTVGPQQVKEAAKEAVQGVGYETLIVCGFAFDPHVSEEVKRYGKLTVLPTKMNPDLAMGDDLLKKTSAGNLFMVFGEPDVEIEKQKDGRIFVELRGVDVYDPTTGQIRSASTDDIACWFIDTEYNGESFFVRHAYFTGADQPYDKLKRTLRADIDEAAWSNLYSTVSQPFKQPETGRIAVKVINHYGDEVLKVFDV